MAVVVGHHLLFILLILLPVDAKPPKCNKKTVGTTYEEGCSIFTCTQKGRKFKWKPNFNPLACCKDKGQMLEVGQVVSEELLDPTCSGECQIKKLWCVQGDPSQLETWVVTTTIEAGVGSCPAVIRPICQANQATCSMPPAEDGCDLGTYCVDKVGNCPLSCPITCPADHMFCPGRSITLSGETCQSEGICVAIPDPSVAGTCPAVCPTSCLPDELSCPLGVDSNGCDLGTQCIKQDPRCPSSAACPVQCADGDVRCSGGIDEAGCPMPDTCMPSTTTCPAKCPVVCNSEEKYCPMGSDPTSGCDLGGMCVPSTTANPLTSLWEVQTDCETPCPVNCQPDQLTCTTGSIDGCNTGWYCMDKTSDSTCPQFCPTVCDPLTSITCDGGVDSQGCLKPQICIPRPPPSTVASTSCEGSQEVTPHCEPICPVVCGEHEMFCPSTQVEDGACATVSGFCLPIQTAGTNCPSICPVPCPAGGFMTCPLPLSPDGCDMGHICLPETVGDCPSHCPIICPADHIECPSHSTDQNDRCPPPPVCLPTDGLCPAHCPILCGADEYVHNLGWDDNGCSKGDICVKVSDGAALCPIMPPVMCSNDTIVCPGSYSDDGCYSGDWCHPRGSCPSPTCPVTCGVDEMPCSSPATHPDCPATTFCVPATVPSTSDPTIDCANVCPSASIECSDGLVCPGTPSVDGCPVAPFCQHSTFTANGTCPLQCPVQCNWETDMICGSGSSIEGCPSLEFCQPMYTNHPDGHQCSSHCPISCPQGALTCPGGVSSDGCPLPDTCSNVPDISDPLTHACPAVCPVPPCEDAAACHLGFDQHGCDLGHYCLPRTPDCSTIPTCPAICSEEEILCTVPSHEAGCSSSTQYCMPATIANPSNPSTNCPAHCPPTCNIGEVLQSMGEDPEGCHLGDVCVSEALATCPPCPPVEYEPNYFMPSFLCPRMPGDPCTCATTHNPVLPDYSSGVTQAMLTNFTCSPTCPCPPGDMPCSTGMDWIDLPPSDDGEVYTVGCPRPDQCLKPSTKCPVFCPVLCEPPFVSCHMGFDAEGCQVAPVCMIQSDCQAAQG